MQIVFSDWQHATDSGTAKFDNRLRTLTLRLDSSRGIGRVTVKQAQSADATGWPETLIVEISGIKELEDFRIRFGDRELEAARRDPWTARVYRLRTGADNRPARTLFESSPAKIQRPTADTVTVRLPGRLFRGESSLAITWVDWLR